MKFSFDSVEDVPEVLKEVATSKMLKAFEDSRVQYITYYPEGFVPNSYKWKCPRTAYVYCREPDGQIKIYQKGYDAKRPHGRGPKWVAFSAKDGRLKSEY